MSRSAPDPASIPPASLAPASRDELVAALAYALRFDKRGGAHRQAAEFTAQIAAETLAGFLEQAGFVVMKRPGVQPPRTPGR